MKWNVIGVLGPDSIYTCNLTNIENSIVEIRLPYSHNGILFGLPLSSLMKRVSQEAFIFGTFLTLHRCDVGVEWCHCWCWCWYADVLMYCSCCMMQGDDMMSHVMWCVVFWHVLWFDSVMSCNVICDMMYVTPLLRRKEVKFHCVIRIKYSAKISLLSPSLYYTGC